MPEEQNEFSLESIANKQPKKSTKKEFVRSDDMRELAETIIREEKIDFRPAQVEYLLVYPHISKTRPSKTVKANGELKFFSSYDYIIEISGELWEALEDEERRILLHHELMRLMPVMNEKTGDWTFKLRKPDVIGFGKIIHEHGDNWAQRIKLSISALYGLTPAQEDKIAL